MNSSNNNLHSRYLSAEASAMGDWLRLGLMLVLLVTARLAQPLHATTVAAPRPHFTHYRLPMAANDSSRFTIYDARYNTRLMLGR